MSYTAEQLKNAGVYDNVTAESDSYARVLMLGPAKLGKTTSIAQDAPRPFIINCDGIGATHGAAKFGCEFKGIDVESLHEWQAACKLAVQLAEDGEIQTIMVDTVTLLSDTLLAELQVRGATGHDLWGKFMADLLRGIRLLKAAPAHLFVIAHQLPGYEDAEGILPAIPGQSAQRLPALLHDVIQFTYDAQRAPERMFALGPQGRWSYGGRHIAESCQIPATATSLFTTLGIKP